VLRNLSPLWGASALPSLGGCRHHCRRRSIAGRWPSAPSNWANASKGSLSDQGSDGWNMMEWWGGMGMKITSNLRTSRIPRVWSSKLNKLDFKWGEQSGICCYNHPECQWTLWTGHCSSGRSLPCGRKRMSQTLGQRRVSIRLNCTDIFILMSWKYNMMKNPTWTSSHLNWNYLIFYKSSLSVRPVSLLLGSHQLWNHVFYFVY